MKNGAHVAFPDRHRTAKDTPAHTLAEPLRRAIAGYDPGPGPKAAVVCLKPATSYRPYPCPRTFLLITIVLR